jgi:L-threonylcarbamoyladenylate synthase
MKAEVLSAHTPALFQAAVQRAADLLRQSKVVALPTETVYGLAANAFDPQAVAEIYTIKGRPAHNPIIVHVAGIEMAKRCVAEWPSLADRLAAAFWPGPLTLVLPRSKEIPDLVTAGGATVGVRWPGHPFIQAVIRECGFPLAAPSANLSGRISPTTAGHVQNQLGDKLPLIIDGGASQVGIESTVLDLTVSQPRVLRPGMIHESVITEVSGVSGEVPGVRCQVSGGEALRSPGLLERHYAPKAKLIVLSWKDDADLRSHLTPDTSHPTPPTLHLTQVIAHTRVPSPEGFGGVSVIPHDAEAFARAIYAELHRCDETGVEWIVVEAPPETEEWRAIADRLKRAAAI